MTASIVFAAMGFARPAYADPAAGTGLQTSVCDNGETYVSSLREQGSELSQAFWHTPIHDPANNAVLTRISGLRTVTIDAGESTDSIPYSFGTLRSEESGHVTTCSSTFNVWHGPVHVRTQGIDVVLVSGRR